MRKHHADVARLIIKSGQPLIPRQMAYRWDLSRGCSCPKEVTYVGRPADGQNKRVTIGPGTAHTLELTVETPCRRCDTCQARRAKHWSARAYTECMEATRTWFGTLTVRPDEHFLASVRATAEARRRGWKWEEMTDEQQFLLLHDQHSREITLYFKRLRKQTGVQVRYIAVVERHESGLPHYHLLIHEQGAQVTYRQLSTNWRLGFTQFKIADVRASRYVAKYLSKAAGARVRASLRYGLGRDIRNGEAVIPPHAKGTTPPRVVAVETSPPKPEMVIGTDQG